MARTIAELKRKLEVTTSLNREVSASLPRRLDQSTESPANFLLLQSKEKSGESSEEEKPPSKKSKTPPKSPATKSPAPAKSKPAESPAPIGTSRFVYRDQFTHIAR